MTAARAAGSGDAGSGEVSYLQPLLNQTRCCMEATDQLAPGEAETVIEMLPAHLPSSAPTSPSPAQRPHSLPAARTRARTHTEAHKKNKSEFQVTIQSIPSQSAIIGWRRMAAEQKSIGQRGWRRPNWCQLRLQRCCRNTGRPRRLTAFNSLYRSPRFISPPPALHPVLRLSTLVFPSPAREEQRRI